MKFERGDVAKGFAEADVVVEGTYRTPTVHQGYIEPHACVGSSEPRRSSVDLVLHAGPLRCARR